LRTDSSVATLGGAGNVRFVAFSPDGSRVFWISEYGVVHVADASTHRPIPALTRHSGTPVASSQPAYVVAITPDGSQLLSSAWKSFGTGHPGGEPIRFVAQHRSLSEEETNALNLTDAASGTPLRRFLVPNTGVWTWTGSIWTLFPHFLGYSFGPGAGFRSNSRGVSDFKGTRILAFSGGGEPVSAAFSPNGRRLATWAWDNVLRIWDVGSGAPVAALAGHQDGISSAAFSPDGTWIVSGSYDRTARIWNLRTGGTPTILEQHEGDVNAVAFAPDGLRVASAGSDKVVRVWDITGHSLAALTGHNASVTTLAFARNGRELASGSEDRSIRVWDVQNFASLGVLNGHTGSITSIAFSGDSGRIVSGGSDELRFWEPASGLSEGVVANTGGDVRQVAISRDSSRLAVAQQDGTVRILNISAPSPPLICTGHEYSSVDDVAFNTDGSRLISTSFFGIRVWDASNCNSLAVLKMDPKDGHSAVEVRVGSPSEGRIPLVQLSADASRVAIGLDQNLEVWDVSADRRIWRTELPGPVSALAFSADGTRIITAGQDIRVWDADRPLSVLTMTGHDLQVTALATSPDGRWIALGKTDSTVRLWSATTGQPVATLIGHDASVGAVAFSPDSTRLVSGGSDRTLRLWDVATHEPILVLQGHPGAVTSVAFTPDGSRIVSASNDGTVRMWDSRLAHDADAALFAERLRSTLRFSADVKDRVQTDSTLDTRVRTAVLAMADARGDNPSLLNGESWAVVKAARLPAIAYDLALRRALLANEAAPWEPNFIRTLGAAYYRLKRYEESLTAITRAAGLRPASDAYDLAFTALAHHQLRHRDEARAALDRVRMMMAPEQDRRRASTDADLKAIYEEASALIGR
jgi:WD40 repeat protein